MKNKPITLEIGGHHIGGSSIATIMGVNPWEGPLSLAMHLKGIVPKTFSSDSLNLMRMGTVLEAEIVKRTEEALQVKVSTENLTYQDPDLPYLVGNLDGTFIKYAFSEKQLQKDKMKDEPIINNKKYVLECKYSMFGLDEVPEHYYHQVNWYMGLATIPRAKLSNLDSGGSLKIFDLEFDEELFIKQKAAAKRFWERYIVGNALPPVDSLKSTTKTLNSMYQKDNGKSFTRSTFMEAWIRDLSKLQGLHKQRESKIKHLKNKIRSRMKKFACYESKKFGKVTYKEDKSQRRTLRFPRGF